MRYFILTVYCFITTCALMAQEENTYYVTSTQLNVRDQPSRHGGIITTLDNGDELTVVDYYDFDKSHAHYDYINNLDGTWKEVKINGQRGYVFSPYIGRKYMLFYENKPILYYPKVKYWYGIYYDSLSRREKIKEIKTHIHNIAADYQNTAELRTDRDQESLFIIATNEKMNEREIGVFKSSFEHKYRPQKSLQLKPGSKISIYSNIVNHQASGIQYELMASGNYVKNDYGISLEDYNLWVAFRDKNRDITFQDLKDYIRYQHHCSLQYCGDIDGDNKPDALLFNFSEKSRMSILLLSSEAKAGQLLGMASSYDLYEGC